MSWLPRVGSVLTTSLLVATLAACGSVGTDASGGSPAPSPSGDQDLAHRAAQLADRYAAAKAEAAPPALDLGDQLEQQDGDWEPAVGENDKLAWLTGHLVAVATLPAAPGPVMVLTGAGQGVSSTVISAGAALAAMTARRSSCGGCTDLEVTGATLTTMDVRTAAGTVTVPAWRFSLRGTAVTLRRVAVPPSALVRTPVPLTPAPGDGLRAESFEQAPGGRTLTVSFTGAHDEPGPCGADYRGVAFESDRAVVVAVLELPRKSSGQEIACADVGAGRSVEVPLRRPLGDRTVLSLADGQSVVQGPAR
ncbi:hypothetical protein BJ986_000315 [Phycicoccus badiiscoriae]|uniref:Lipoprotein n=1 Tax=Pedococcus badiiscoriae TaxID=642776 RepID=A0A852W9V3_9MICO|nr:hypothetical protein [Pedococcus badiiscoriae]NYG05828.1 hypothetical protein [Pedococcus badiiscoriae]